MTNPINIKSGKNIKAIRLKRGITQEKLAELTKTSYKYIQRIEGKTNPPDIRLSTLERIARALKTTPSKLIDFK
jgi:transcriptional regulator with XRE-family HTH domain